MNKLLIMSVIAVGLLGCSIPNPVITEKTLIIQGLWTPPQQVDQNIFILGGWNTEDAISGAASHCRRIGKRMESFPILPIEISNRATITYSCK